MPTTSSDRGFSVPVNSSDNGAWGLELNATIAAIDSILGGTTVLNSSNGLAVTLTSSQAQTGRIEIVGALSTTFVLTLPASNYAMGNYQIWHNSSAAAGYNVQCQTLGGGTIALISSGAMRTINVDGTNVQFIDNTGGTGSFASPANPPVFSTTVGRYIGTGFQYTPVKSGNLFVMFSFSIFNSLITATTAGLYYGTGTPPANFTGVASVGTVMGTLIGAYIPANTVHIPCSIQAYQSGFAIGTPYWFDIGISNNATGNVQVQGIHITVLEL